MGRRVRKTIVLCFAVVAAAASFGSGAPQASAAGNYHVRFCSSNPAPIGFLDDRSKRITLEPSCNPTDGQITQLAQTPGGVLNQSELFANGTLAWKLNAPADTLVSGLEFLRTYEGVWFAEEMEWQMRLGGALGGPGFVLDERRSNPDSHADFTNPPPLHETFDIAALVGQGVPSIISTFGCLHPAGANQPCPSFRVFGVQLSELDVRLEDLFPPEPPILSGTMFDPGPVSGTRTVTFRATDRGSGIELTDLKIDGIDIHLRFTDRDGACHPPFLKLVPCPANAGSSDFIDTARLPNGTHNAELEVRDAAGQVTTGIATFTSLNPPEPFEPPKIRGTASVGQTLTADTGGWWVPPTSFNFTWLRCPASVSSGADASKCSPIPGASGTGSYVVATADADSRIIVKVSASNSGGATDAFSDPTEPVTGGGGASPPRDTTAPTLRKVTLAPKRLRLLARSKPKHTNLRFISSEAGTLTVAVSKAKAKKPLTTIESPLAAGSGKLAIGPRVGKVRLRPGRYKLTVSARDAAGNVSAPVTLTLTVAR